MDDGGTNHANNVKLIVCGQGAGLAVITKHIPGRVHVVDTLARGGGNGKVRLFSNRSINAGLNDYSNE